MIDKDYIPAVGPRDSSRAGQAESDSPRIAIPGFLETHKGLEGPFHVIRSDARTSVTNLDHHLSLALVDADGSISAIFNGVAHEILDKRLQRGHIGLDHG